MATKKNQDQQVAMPTEDNTVMQPAEAAEVAPVEDATAPAEDATATVEAAAGDPPQTEEAPEGIGNSVKFAEAATELPNTVANNPTYVYSDTPEGRKKFLIRGKHFSIPVNGTLKDMTDTDLAHPDNQALIDEWVRTGNGILREVFE